MSWYKRAVELYAHWIEDGRQFAQAAYRDGEWRAMLGVHQNRPRNVNGERYDSELGGALKETLLDWQGQWLVYFDGGCETVRRASDEWLEQHMPDRVWIRDRPIGRANEVGEAAPFFRALRSRHVVLVGPRHLRSLSSNVVRVEERVVVPDGVAWKHVDRITEDVLDLVGPGDFVLICAGMASNLLIHQLWPIVRDEVTLYDAGALLDPYAGVYSRRTFRDATWRQRIMPQNIP